MRMPVHVVFRPQTDARGLRVIHVRVLGKVSRDTGAIKGLLHGRPIASKKAAACPSPWDDGAGPGGGVAGWCAARLARFKMPQSVRLRDALPKTPTQRVEKYKLREEYARGV